MRTGIDILCTYMLHPPGETRYDLNGASRCAHGFVGTCRNSLAIPRSLRLALRLTGRTAQAVQLPFLG